MSEYGEEGEEKEWEDEISEKEDDWDVTDEQDGNDKQDHKLNESIINRYINKIIRQYKKTIELNQRHLKLNVNHNYVNLKNSIMVNTYINRGLYDYYGIIYRIIDKRTGKLLYGFTLDSIDHRWKNYKKFKPFATS